MSFANRTRFPRGGSQQWLDAQVGPILRTELFGPPPVSGPVVNEAASTGVTFTSVGPYRVATFNSNGTLVVVQGGEFEYLVVAGGGPGGSVDEGFAGGGGGGAGGVLQGTATFSAETYNIAVGLGGVPAIGAGTNGGDSSITGTNAPPAAIGGGRGGSEESNPSTSGGSGGGGAFSNTAGTSQAGSPGTAGQGFAGGNCDDGPGAGGGGAGGPGDSTTFNTYGEGGIGVLSDITGTPTYYGGGGAGAAPSFDVQPAIQGGLGGGGNAPQTFGDVVARAGLPGTDGLGGGGGGSSGVALGGAGGRGVVIVRWIPGSTDPGPSPTLNYWNGTAFVPGVLKRWNGTAWVTHTLKRWNGTAWA